MTTTKVMAWVHFAAQPSDLYLATATDATAKELVTLAAGASLGDVAGQIVTGVDVQVGDGSVLEFIEIKDAAGGQKIQVMGGERSVVSSSTEANMNLNLRDLNIHVERGMVLNATTAD
ncbi:MAG TPA: hypothetical protein EYN18_02740 [Nitrospirales bacterium]|nr:hypothetical protein [Nitrospirales bacterium]